MLLIAVAVIGAAAALYWVEHKHGSDAAVHRTAKQPAPDFTLPQLDGQDLRLSSFRGKVVLLDFWASWCEPCRVETPHLIELQEKYGDRGLQIIGVSMDDSPDPARAFVQQFHMNYPVVMGNAKTGELYGGVLGLPIAFLIDRDGRIYSKHIGATEPEVFEKDIASLLPKP
ncbi:MAG TPA: TlpA disulfide reductase family protein [Candidatus Sulfotelmatobacter sp.]|nr:TlpA disulfide reductase family protein [Candidatus Sulfotelmatobacter sp.]